MAKKRKTMADNKKWIDAKDLILDALHEAMMDSSTGLAEYSLVANLIHHSIEDIEGFLKCFVEKNN